MFPLRLKGPKGETVDEPGAATLPVDIVLPVHGGLRHVRACLEALRLWTEDHHRLIVVDDASDDETRQVLLETVRRDWGASGTVLVNERNLGFLQTANLGMRAGSAPVVVLLNSDTLVAPGWVEGLTTCLRSRPDVGVVSPLSNNANLTRIAVPYGTHHLRVAEAVRRVSPRAYPEIHLASGMCLVARRKLLEDLAYFDERYGRGYFEESDLCLRAADAGWRTLADDATYVHHHGWGSFGAQERNELMRTNAALFEQRWGEGRHRRLRRRVLRQRLFAELERRVRVALEDCAQVSPRRRLPRASTRIVAEKARLRGPAPTRQRIPTSGRYPLEEWCQIAQVPPSGRRPPEASGVVVLLDDLGLTPTATDVLQLADRLLRRGLTASVATAGTFDPALLVDPCRLRPYVLSGPDELLSTLPPHGVVLATSPATVFDALLLRQRDGSAVATWFDPQAVGPATGWPDEGWSTAVAPRLAQAHLGPAVPLPVAEPAPVYEVPIGVDADVYRPRPLDGRPPRVLIGHDRDAGPRATADVGRAVECLRSGHIDVTVYGDPVPDMQTTTEPLAPQAVEAALLADHAVVLEVAPVPGLERFRLRCAATGTPVVLASPTTRSCPLRVGDEAYAAPRGDVEHAVDLATAIVGDPGIASGRVAAARRRAADSPLEAEAEALAHAVASIEAGMAGNGSGEGPADGPGDGTGDGPPPGHA